MPSATKRRRAAKAPLAVQPADQDQHQGQYEMQPPCVAAASDVALVDDFCAFLESRVLTKNVGLLRRLLVEFHARETRTLAQFKCFSANLVAVLPFGLDDVNRHRRAVELLLKPKPQLVDDGECAFQFLFERVASKNLATLKHIFRDFCMQSERTLVAFVKSGTAAVSLIPGELQDCHVDPRLAANPYAQLQYASPRVAPVYLLNQQQQGYYHQPLATVPGVTPKHERAKKIATAHRKTHPATGLSARSPIARDSSSPSRSSEASESPLAVDGAGSNGKRVVKKPVRYYTEQVQEALIAEVTKSAKRAKKEPDAARATAASPRISNTSKPTSRKKQKWRKAPPLDEDEDEDASSIEDRSHGYSVLKRPKPSNHMIDSMIEEVLLQCEDEPEAEAQPTRMPKTDSTVPKQQQHDHKSKHKRRRLNHAPTEAHAPTEETQTCELRPAPPSFHWTAQDTSSYQLKRAVRDRLRSVESKAPWRHVFAPKNTPLPFDELRAPRLAEKLRFFWKSQAHAVWERNFWMSMPQEGDARANVARKTRQQVARHFFDTIIGEAYRVFGAAFFVTLDEQRHPWWWYRRAIVDVVALHRIAGEQQCWAYLEGQQHERFPDCGLELPLKSPNYGVLRRHQSASAAMWSVSVKNQHLLNEIAEIKNRRARGELLDGGSDAENAETTTIRSGEPSESNDAEPKQENDDEAGDVDHVALEEKVVVDEAEDDGDDVPDAGEAASLSAEDEGSIDEDSDEKEELLIEKIALASCLEVDMLQPRPASKVMTMTDSVGSSADAENGNAAPVKAVHENASAAEKTASGGPTEALEKELEPTRFAAFIRKISPFGGGYEGVDE